MFTCKFASRYNGCAIFPNLNFKKWSVTAACNFHIATSENGPSLQCFVHFDFEMCFSLQRRAIFPNLNFQKCSEMRFSLQRRAIFPHRNFKKMVRACSVLYILTSKCASRYSGVQFFISPLNSYLCTRRFTEVTFRPSRPTNHCSHSIWRLP